MSKAIKIKRGLNIRLQGEADKVFAAAPHSETFAIKPPNFHGMVPKMLVKVGEQVKAGTPIFYDKRNEKLVYTSPVSGEVADIVRGEKRRILEVLIRADKEIQYESFKQADPNSLSREEIIEEMLKSGTWPFMRQRPFDVVADPFEMPRSIFISAFDSAPLAPDNDFIMHGNGEEFQVGLDAISKLTKGKVHLNTRNDGGQSKVFTNSKNVQINKVSGPHPAGNVGVQIHHIEPINKGEVVWYLYPQDVLTIGRLFKHGKFDASRVVALTGSEVKTTKYYKTIIGSSIKEMVAGNVEEGDLRYIAGNVLTGEQIVADGYLGFYDTQITVIPEGNEPLFFMTKGWMGPGLNKFSMSRSYPTWLMPGKKFRLNSNNNGEERAFVVTGQYEKVFPFDIYPVHLIKAIMTNDIDGMENLGIYEVGPEDFALCEFVCTSKIEVQRVVRDGLDLVQEECT
jgi:Na+-transporting NADH:ubiquinone oxidoreductase subunit A